MKPFQFILATMSFLLFGVACQDDITKAKVAFTSYESTSSQKGTQAIKEIQFDSATMVLDNFDLSKTIWNDSIAETIEDSVAYFENLGKYSASFYGPFNINLLSGSSSPEIDFIEVEPEIYNNLEVIMGKGYGDSICFFLLGTAMNDTASYSFEVKSIYGSTFELTNQSGFEIEQNKTNIIWIEINLPLLFDGVNLEMADKDSTGLIKINEHFNNNLQEIIMNNITTSSKIGLDLNLDGEIDQ
jgi:hypothetical protein